MVTLGESASVYMQVQAQDFLEDIRQGTFL
jgi:hypothetical protein